MKVNVVVFARARELIGSDQLQLDLPPQSTIHQFKQQLLQQFPALNELLPHCAFAINREYATDDQVLEDGCEVGLIPPVSGG